AREKSLAADPPTPFTRAKKASLMARISWTLMSSESVTMRMSSINGATSGIVATITPFLRAMFPMMSSATRTWMNTVAGAPCRSTATCGFLIPSLSAGRPIVTAIGCGSRLGTARRLLPVVPREPDLRHQRQRFEHYHHQQNASHQRLQQRLREQDGERHECEVSKPDCAQRGNRCFAPDLRFCATRSQ